MTITTTTSSGRTAGISRNFVRGFAAFMRVIVKRYTGRRATQELSEMPDYLLKDMGLTRNDVLHALEIDWRDDPTTELSLAASRRRRRMEL